MKKILALFVFSCFVLTFNSCNDPEVIEPLKKENTHCCGDDDGDTLPIPPSPPSGQ